jgi:sterol desaturase/sphingolipid hydroxylase (fatty acid hydroxylase superfamily)
MHRRLNSGWFPTALALGTFIALTWLERRRPLRAEVEPKVRREARNLAVAGLGAISLELAGAPLMRWLTRHVDRRAWGLLPRISMPRWLKIAAALAFMDYTFYIWHVMTHRVPLLWRFHLVHHVDLDLDASTALRFHFGELLAGIPWQAAQIALIGLDPRTYSIWQMVFLSSILFHHSSIRIPIKWERRLSWFVVTPRMHGIHHSIVEEETNSNWSSGLNIWDRLHATLRLNVPQTEVTIGVPAYRDPISVALPQIIRLPFWKLEPSWVLPDQSRPQAHEETVPRGCLLP